MKKIPFNRAHVGAEELERIRQAIEAGHLSGHGRFTRWCHQWLEAEIGVAKALLTHSCTAALEMAALLAGVGPGDEVVLPSYTFVSTANAFVLRGATPVFVDIRPDTLNLDESLLESAITERTRAVVPVHYAGVSAAMGEILDVARRHDLVVIEDAAQAISSRDEGGPVGRLGDCSTLSFHETKNVTCGEGGALLLNRQDWVERAEILWEKGTDRSKFFRGQVDKYTWVDVGSSYLPGEVSAAFLAAQLERAGETTARRLAIWDVYHRRFAELEARGLLRRPVIPAGLTHNAHMYYLLLTDRGRRDGLIAHLKARDIGAVFHYVPLHSSPAGRRWGRTNGDLPVTDDVAGRLVRLPLWVGLGEGEVDRVAGEVERFLLAG